MRHQTVSVQRSGAILESEPSSILSPAGERLRVQVISQPRSKVCFIDLSPCPGNLESPDLIVLEVHPSIAVGGRRCVSG